VKAEIRDGSEERASSGKVALASAIERATPNPYFAPGPVQNNGFMGYRAVSIHVFNPPPEGGTSNTISQMVMPK